MFSPNRRFDAHEITTYVKKPNTTVEDGFGAVFRQLQRGKALEPFVFYAGNRSRVGSLENKGFLNHASSGLAAERVSGTVGSQLVH